MQNLFNREDANGIVLRLTNLTPETKAVWGKMNVAQMLAHSQAPLEVALGNKTLKHSFIGFLFGKMAKKQMLAEGPFKRNLPTDKSFLVKDERVFYDEQQKLVALVKKFTETDPVKIAARAHPFFGKMTEDEWGVLQWKHLDHHLIQFGA
ncbi:hypothetical protein BH11BAC6_BH11BAC6_13970 [soil metagenome]